MLNEEKKITLKQYSGIVLQLGLFLLVVRQFQIENPAFLRLALLTSIGFMVHALLPLRYRLSFFLLLSFGGIGLVFGFPNSFWLVGIGFVLIGICHLPFSFAVRVVLLLLTGSVLAVLRIEWISTPWSSAVWPILGSMFMFRLIVYLYDLRHENVAPSVTRTLSYFFLLPNVCFPLFPVVDYKTFRRTYYDEDPSKIYQRGMDWMARGVIQLLLYRFVYYYLTLAPAEVVTTGDLLRYLTYIWTVPPRRWNASSVRFSPP
jgi:alginate O-acetyltransferase complex protein AlgI